MSKNILALSVVDRIIGGAPYMCQGDFAEQIRYAATLGYTGVELNIADPAQLNLPAIRSAVRETGLSIVAFGTGRVYVNEGISLTDADPAVRKQAMARMRTFLDIAAEFDSTVILGCIRGNIGAAQKTEDVISALRQSMLELESYASRETAMVLEPINRYENNFLCSVPDTAKFIHDSGLVHTKILMDTFHMNIEDGDPAEVIGRYGKDVAYVHISDSNRKYPGCGHINFPAVLAALKAQDYAGAFCAECHANGDLNDGCIRWLEQMHEMLQ